MHRTLLTGLLVFSLGCNDSSSPRVPAGTFSATVVTNTGTTIASGDSAVWVTTGLGLFNTELVTDSVVPGIPSPFTIFVALTDTALAARPLPPGTYQLDPSDSTRPTVALLALGFQAIADSGTVVVTSAQADSVFQGRIDAWLRDTTTASLARFHVKARFAATPFH